MQRSQPMHFSGEKSTHLPKWGLSRSLSSEMPSLFSSPQKGQEDNAGAVRADSCFSSPGKGRDAEGKGESEKYSAPPGQPSTQSPQWMQSFRVSGLWQYLQLKLQPCKKTAVRFPGPSTALKGIIRLTGALISGLSSPEYGHFALRPCRAPSYHASHSRPSREFGSPSASRDSR